MVALPACHHIFDHLRVYFIFFNGNDMSGLYPRNYENYNIKFCRFLGFSNTLLDLFTNWLYV